MMSNRTRSREEAGQSATRVGTVETTVMSLATSQGPTSTPDRTSERGRNQGRPVGPGQPHFLTAGVEGDRQPRHHPVLWTDRVVLQKHPSFRVHEGCGVAVRHRHPLGGAGRSRGEDDPGVVVRRRPLPRKPPRPALTQADAQVIAEDCRHAGLGEDHPGPLVRVVGVHGHIGRARQQCADDGDIEVGRARFDAHADPGTAPDPRLPESSGQGSGCLVELGIGQGLGPAVEADRVGGLLDRPLDDVDQRARGRGTLTRQEDGGNVVDGLGHERIVPLQGEQQVPPGGAWGALGGSGLRASCRAELCSSPSAVNCGCSRRRPEQERLRAPPPR